MTDQELMDMAQKAAEYAYVPYSKFPVGAALECSDGTIFTGCNVENAAFTPTSCAERTALFSAPGDRGADGVRIEKAGHGTMERLASAFGRSVHSIFSPSA